MKKQFLFVAIIFASLVSYAQHDHGAHAGHAGSNTPVFKDEKLGAAYGNYIRLKDALVASKKEDVKSAAAALEQSLQNFAEGKKVAVHASKLSQAATLEEQRGVFVVLSDEMARLVKGGKLSSGNVFVEYCPMANNNEGAYWLSNEKQVKNPYFGDMMLTCGSVKETLQ